MRIYAILFFGILASTQTFSGAHAAGAGEVERKSRTIEDNFYLWALIRHEAKYPDLAYPFKRRVGDFAGQNLRGLVASGLNLTGFNFSDSDLRAADFTNTILRDVQFRGADLSESVFISANEKGAIFNSTTKLPFSRNEALRRGWVETRP